MDITEGIKKVFLAGVGAVATTAETAKDVIDNLVQKGEITVEQGKVLNEELKRSAKEKVNDHVTVNIVKEYKDVLNAVDHMSKEDLDALKEKIAQAEAKKTQEEKAPANPDAPAEDSVETDCGNCEEKQEENNEQQ